LLLLVLVLRLSERRTSKNYESGGGGVDRLKAQDFLKAVDGCALEDDSLAFVPAGWVVVKVWE
jgi:hypothetical protein